MKDWTIETCANGFRRSFRQCALILLLLTSTARAAAGLQSPASGPSDGAAIAIGQAVVALHGPWKFRTGDDLRWADANFDDSDWEAIDLTPAAGAHDADVGLTGYVAGWTARGHAGYSGYAWYRMRVSVTAPAGAMLALAGPADVDDAYQLFFRGRLLGGIGDFSGTTPVVYATQPRVFPLAPSAAGLPDSAVVALRVWMSPQSIGAAPDVGGIHIAPELGEAAEIENRYRAQWLELIRGYFLEIVQALIFAALAAMSCSLLMFESANRSYVWLAVALVLTGAARANLALVSWTQWESAKSFEAIENAVLIPLILGTWTMTWYYWLGLRGCRWVRTAVSGLTAGYMVAQFVIWFSGSASAGVSVVSSGLRLGFVGLTFFVAYEGFRQARWDIWSTLPAMLLISIGLFASEISLLRIPGIWFPYGTGVSRTQFAYAGFDVALFLLLLRRLRFHAEPCGSPSAHQAA
jgi:hypothetical protein